MILWNSAKELLELFFATIKNVSNNFKSISPYEVWMAMDKLECLTEYVHGMHRVEDNSCNLLYIYVSVNYDYTPVGLFRKFNTAKYLSM